MKTHGIAVTDDIAGGTRILVRLPRSAIIILSVDNHKIPVRQNLPSDEVRRDGDPAHPPTNNNTKLVSRLHGLELSGHLEDPGSLSGHRRGKYTVLCWWCGDIQPRRVSFEFPT
jgi:hypothetical protein